MMDGNGVLPLVNEKVVINPARNWQDLDGRKEMTMKEESREVGALPWAPAAVYIFFFFHD